MDDLSRAEWNGVGCAYAIIASVFFLFGASAGALVAVAW